MATICRFFYLIGGVVNVGMSKNAIVVTTVLLSAFILTGCGAGPSPIQTANASATPQVAPMTPEQRAGSVSYQMDTAVDALSQASTKSEHLRAALGAKAAKDLDKLDSLFYSAGETIGDYPNNPPTGKKGADLKAWINKANTAATLSLGELREAETLASSEVKDDEFAGDIRVAEDALRGAIQTSSAIK
jgi:hypothetical protein